MFYQPSSKFESSFRAGVRAAGVDLLLTLLGLSPRLATAQQYTVTPVTIFSTGVDDNAALLPEGTVGDSHYSLVVPADGMITATDQEAVPSPWFPDSVSVGGTPSGWIVGTQPDGEPFPSNQVAFFQTQFDAPASGELQVYGWATDCCSTAPVLLNGASIGAILGGPSGPQRFEFDAAVVAGPQTMDFAVSGLAPALGLRIEIDNAFVVSTSAPEPASAAVLGVALIWMLKRRRSVVN